MAQTPPFNIATTIPAATDLVSQFPTPENLYRDTVNSWLGILSNPATGKLRTTAPQGEGDLRVDGLQVRPTSGASGFVRFYDLSGNQIGYIQQVDLTSPSSNSLRFYLLDSGGSAVNSFIIWPDGTATLDGDAILTSSSNIPSPFAINIPSGQTLGQFRIVDSAGKLMGYLQAASNTSIRMVLFESNGSTAAAQFIVTPTGATINGDTVATVKSGTFTPTLTFGTSAGSGTAYGTRYGQWQQVGQVVTVNIGITLSNRGTGTGEPQIGTLPKSISNDAVFNVRIDPPGGASSGSPIFGLRAASGNTAIGVRIRDTSGETTSNGLLANNSVIRITGSYFTTD